jgi:hypothetical protein
MKKEKWEEFTNQIDTNMQNNNINSFTLETDTLEKLWHKIHTSVINAALQHIPNKKYTIKHSFHTFSPKATALHKDLKQIGSIINNVKNSFKHHQPITNTIINQIHNINQKHDFDIPNPPSDPQSLSQWISQIKQSWKAIYYARSLENSQHLRQHINKAIDNRCERLLTQPTKMINSILNRHTDPVILHNIKTENEVITDPSTILSHVKQHFYQWTKHQPYQTETFNSHWANEYQPKTSINMN